MHFSEYEGHAAALARDIVALLRRTYRVPAAKLDTVYRILSQGLVAVYQDAHELSLITKRDLLSARISVTVYSAGVLDDGRGEDIWPDMGNGFVAGDRVIGVYSLGLEKVAKDGGTSHLALPKSFTTALLREVGVHMA